MEDRGRALFPLDQRKVKSMLQVQRCAREGQEQSLYKEIWPLQRDLAQGI